MLATYGLTAWNKSLNQEELKTWYEARWMPVFRFGGNYREDETTHLIGEQQEIYEAVSGETSKFLQYVEDDEQMRLRKRYLDDLYRLKENYPVLTYVRAKTEGCTILRFRICRYQTRVARSKYGREVNTPSSSRYKRALLAFCGATLVEYSYQWLRDSTFLKIVFPKDCRSTHACTVGGMLESSDAEFSDGVLFSSVHREHGSPDGSDAYLRCYVIPKFRATVRFLVPELLEIMFLTLVALIWGFIPWSGVSAHVPASLFLMPGMTVPSGRVNGWLTTTLRPAGHSSVTANPDPSPSVSYSPTSLLPCSYHSHMCSVNDPSSCSSYMTVSSSAILELDVLGEHGGRVVFVFNPPCRVVHSQHLFA